MKHPEFNHALTVERANDLLTYNPETGVIRWRNKRLDALSRFSAGCVDSRGYIKLMVDGVSYGAHRVAWLIAYGKWPDDYIDHINQKKADNRLCNLRDVTHKLNTENVGPKRKHGLMGTSFHKQSGLWHSTVGHNYKYHSCGYFKTEIEAHQAYLKKKADLHLAFVGDTYVKDIEISTP